MNTQYNIEMMCYRMVPPETYVILLTKATPINSVKKKRKDIVTHASTWMYREDIMCREISHKETNIV